MRSYFFVSFESDVMLFESCFVAPKLGQDRKEKEFILQYVGYASLDMIEQSIVGNEFL